MKKILSVVLLVTLGLNLQPVIAITLEQEIKVGQQIDREFTRTYKIIPDHPYQHIVERIGRNIADASERPKLPWTFRIYHTDSPQALSVPGGFVYISDSMLDTCKTDDEIAAVLAHEIVHSALSHGIIGLDKQSRTELLTTIVNLATKTSWASLIGDLGILRYSRAAEIEADDHGLDYIIKARYSPVGLMGIFSWLKSQDAQKQKYAEFLFTHPDAQKRYERICAKIIPAMVSRAEQTFGLPAIPTIYLDLKGKMKEQISSWANSSFISVVIKEMPKVKFETHDNTNLPKNTYAGKRCLQAVLIAGDIPKGQLNLSLTVKQYDPFSKDNPSFVQTSETRWVDMNNENFETKTREEVAELAQRFLRSLTDTTPASSLGIVTRAWHDYSVFYRFEAVWQDAENVTSGEYYVLRDDNVVGKGKIRNIKMEMFWGNIVPGDILVASFQRTPSEFQRTDVYILKRAR